jgi:rhodanese-related sulfurtransferase
MVRNKSESLFIIISGDSAFNLLSCNLYFFLQRYAMNLAISEISVEELALRLIDLDPALQLIDVREPQEAEIAAIEGFELFPLSKFAEWSDRITLRFNPTAETFVLCHHGMRSAQMCQWLHNVGFTNVRNVIGGIDAYSLLVNPSIPRY